MQIQPILLQAGGNAMMPQLLMFGAIFVVFYFFMIRPQQKKAKEEKEFINQIKKGDDVVTIGGMHGKVYDVADLTVVLEFEKGFKATFDKASISMSATKKMSEPAKK